MVAISKIVVMAVCVLVSVVALVIPYMMLKKRSSKIETGLLGAVGYGFLGYIWQAVFSVFLVVIVGRLPIPGSDGFRLFAINFLGMLCGTACTTLSLYWGIYLTNQKQRSLYRSAAVGIGFALGKISIECVALYVRDIYYSIQMNRGTYQAGEEIQQAILERTAGSVLSGTYKCLVMFVIIFAITLIMGNYYIQNQVKKAWISVICLYGGVILINMILRQAFESRLRIAYDISYVIVYTILAAAAGIILSHWLRQGVVEMNPLTVIRGMKGKVKS